MRNIVVVLLLVAVAILGLLVSRGPAAPALSDKPAKWEYAELQSLRERDPRLPAGFGGAGGFGGGQLPPGGVGFPPGAAPPPPAAAPPAVPAAPQPTVRWTTADEEIDAVDWKALGDKLRAPAAKKDGSATMHRLRVLNRLSADGWEIYEHNGTNSWTFRRQVH